MPGAGPAALGNASAAGKLTTDEGMSSGAVSGEVMAAYVGAMGGYTWFLPLIFGFIFVEAARVLTTVWLSFWTGARLINSGPSTSLPLFD